MYEGYYPHFANEDTEAQDIHSFFPQTFIQNDMTGGQGRRPCKGDLVMIINGQQAFLKALRNTVLTIKDKAERERRNVMSCGGLSVGFQDHDIRILSGSWTLRSLGRIWAKPPYLWTTGCDVQEKSMGYLESGFWQKKTQKGWLERLSSRFSLPMAVLGKAGRNKEAPFRLTTEGSHFPSPTPRPVRGRRGRNGCK